MTFTIEAMRSGDWEQVCAIYLEGVATGEATFETEVPAWEDWDAAHLPFARLVARADAAGGAGDKVLGWAALAPVSRRRVYAGVAEVSVYVARHARGEGVGASLLAALVEESERSGIWMLQAGIFPENTASLALHRRAGFREVGRRERIGQLQGRWRDTLLLERRSRRVGID